MESLTLPSSLLPPPSSQLYPDLNMQELHCFFCDENWAELLISIWFTWPPSWSSDRIQLSPASSEEISSYRGERGGSNILYLVSLAGTLYCNTKQPHVWPRLGQPGWLDKMDSTYLWSWSSAVLIKYPAWLALLWSLFFSSRHHITILDNAVSHYITEAQPVCSLETKQLLRSIVIKPH